MASCHRAPHRVIRVRPLTNSRFVITSSAGSHARDTLATIPLMLSGIVGNGERLSMALTNSSLLRLSLDSAYRGLFGIDFLPEFSDTAFLARQFGST